MSSGPHSFFYSVLGLTLGSAIALPELDQVSGTRADASFLLVTAATHVPDDHRWNQGRDLGGLPMAHDGSAIRLQFPGFAEFQFASDDQCLIGRPDATTSLETTRHLLIDQVLPYWLAVRGVVVLHASTVVIGNGAVAFLGASGAGKSTLAAALAVRGVPILGDDTVRVAQGNGAVFAVPSYPSCRLRPDALDAVVGPVGPLPAVAQYTNKVRWSCSELGLLPTRPPLRHIVLLADIDVEASQDLTLIPMSSRAGFFTLLQNSFNLILPDMSLQTSLENLSRLADQCQFWKMSYPRNFALLDRTVTSVIAAFSGGI